MRKLAIYIRSLFCKHDWEYLGNVEYWDKSVSTANPVRCVERWRCKKCGYIMKDKY